MPMDQQFIPIADTESLQELFARSHDAPVVVFKHSSTCPISAAAYDEMLKLAEPIALVVVQRARGVSREVEKQTGVRHESPQAIVLRNGQAVWSASHWNITSDAVARALSEHK